MRRSLLLLASLILLVSASFAGKKTDEVKSGNEKLVDEGTFAIFQNGQRVGTEKFSIRQFPASSLTSSEVEIKNGPSGGVLQQSSELTLLPDSSLSRYEYKETSPEHRTITVVPSDQLLTLHSDVDGKNTDHTFFLTPQSFVLDDYFFITREVLLWRYLASSCKPRPTGEGCDLIRARIPIVIPCRTTSDEVYLQFKGYDDTPLEGRPQHLREFLMTTDGPDWLLWLDANQKLLRISIPDAHIEVLRQ